MTRNRSFAFFAAVLLLAAAVPAFAVQGSADFTRLVFLGDSYTAGVSNGSLNERHQIFSPAAIFAQQVGQTLCQPNAAATDNCFAQPLVTWPGIPSELVLTAPSLAGVTTAPGQGVPVMLGFGRPYNNLAVPGSMLADILNTTGAEKVPHDTAQFFAPFILRGLGTEVDQAIALHATFVGAWIGGDDFFLAATSGLAKDCSATLPVNCLTPTATFKTEYNAILDKLTTALPGAGMFVGTFPPAFATALPRTSTIPAVIINPATSQPLLINGAPVPLIGVKEDGTVGQLPLGTFVLLDKAPKLQTGFGIPPQFAAIPPFNQLPNVGKPLDDTDTLTPNEFATIAKRISDFNDIITASAAAHGIPVADTASLFNDFTSGTLTFAGIPFNTKFITGGLVGLDGEHLTDLGYTLLANKWIKAVNGAYGTQIPIAPVTRFFANNDTTATPTSIDGLHFSDDAVKTMEFLNTPPAPPRLRAAHH
jgi:lysophospholipase L1-like esterase